MLTAIRDSEYRVLALGYNTALYKTFVFALAGGLAGLAGALYVAALGTTGPGPVRDYLLASRSSSSWPWAGAAPWSGRSSGRSW